METKFVYKKSYESSRIIGIYSDLANSLFQDNGFLVLPYRVPGHPKTVYLPLIHGFNPTLCLNELREILDYPYPYSSEPLAIKLLNLLKKSDFRPEGIDLKHTKKTEEQWHLIESQFEDYFLDIFPQYRQYRIKTEIIWTRYGTLVSFNGLPQKGKNLAVRIILRDDMGLSQIVEGFISSIFFKKMRESYNYSFLQREAVTDFIILNTKLSRLFPDFYPTLDSSPKSNLLEKYYKDSATYIAKLGFKNKGGIHLKDEKIMIGQKPLKYRFSKTEEIIIKKLIGQNEEPVSYYDLGDLVWKDNADKFSLWALSRMIFKIRNKLRKNGLSPEHIKNLRGQGYYYTSQP